MSTNIEYTYHRTIKMKPADVKSGSFAEYNEEYNAKDPKFKIGDHVRISYIYIKVIFQIGVKKLFWLKKLRIQSHGLMLLVT